MFWLYNLKLVTNTLIKNKRRTILTMLGIVIGVAAVIFINSVGAGAQSLVFNQVKSIGSNLVNIFPGGSEEEGPPASVMGIIIATLTYNDAEVIIDRIAHVEAVASYVSGNATLSWRSTSSDTNFSGTTASYLQVEDTQIEDGRFFTKDEEKDLSKVIVLGSQIKEDIFGDQNPIGETIKLKKENFKVIGVMKKRGSSGFQNYDNQVFIPLKTAQKILLGINHVSFIRTKIDKEENIITAVEQIQQLLRERHDISNPAQDDFSVRNQAQALQVLGSITDILRLFMTAVAGLGLLVGGIGIMNIMLVAVNERVREIGLRKAIGATYKNILRQFLSETIFISSCSGLIGIIIGVILSFLTSLIIRSLNYSWDFVISWQSILLGFGVSFAIGLIFGVYPAKKAAKLEPVEALRYE
ncbi:MAG TPA: ABC transporter permease [Candidatus Magasanikbacteria bacterium]|nr:ABC transporter permease [Candidatus Magasanikbacteria bacterium]